MTSGGGDWVEIVDLNPGILMALHWHMKIGSFIFRHLREVMATARKLIDPGFKDFQTEEDTGDNSIEKR